MALLSFGAGPQDLDPRVGCERRGSVRETPLTQGIFSISSRISCAIIKAKLAAHQHVGSLKVTHLIVAIDLYVLDEAKRGHGLVEFGVGNEPETLDRKSVV